MCAPTAGNEPGWDSSWPGPWQWAAHSRWIPSPARCWQQVYTHLGAESEERTRAVLPQEGLGFLHLFHHLLWDPLLLSMASRGLRQSSLLLPAVGSGPGQPCVGAAAANADAWLPGGWGQLHAAAGSPATAPESCRQQQQARGFFSLLLPPKEWVSTGGSQSPVDTCYWLTVELITLGEFEWVLNHYLHP